jgi:uncharacterized delta-60 repeat protein
MWPKKGLASLGLWFARRGSGFSAGWEQLGASRLVTRALRQGVMGLLVGLLLLPAGSVAQEAGDLDASFGVGGKVITDFAGNNDEGKAVALQPDGKIVLVGSASDLVTGGTGFGVARYLPGGDLDATFGEDGLVTTRFESDALAQAVELQPDGRIVVAGYIVGDTNFGSALARYLPNGDLDATFGEDGLVTTDISAPVYAVVLQPDGKIVAIGGMTLARYSADGTLDTTFGDEGLVTIDFEQVAAALQLDGKIVTAGSGFNPTSSQYEFELARYLPDGTLDTTFGIDGRVTTDAGGSGSASGMALQPDGKIVTVGSIFNVATSHRDFALVRYLPDGMLDTTFSGDGRVTTDFGGPSQALAVSLQRDGRIVAAGHALFTDFALARYLPDGALDTTFSGDGLVTTGFGTDSSSYASDLIIQSDGRLVAGGAATMTGEGGFDFALARYESGLAPGHGPPTTAEECKHSGWRAFDIPRVFESQGDCIQFVNTGR